MHRTRFLLLVATGLFLVLMFGIASAQIGGTIGYGSSLFGTLTAERLQILYSFNATANDLITVEVSPFGGGLDPKVTLLGPDQRPMLANDNADFGSGRGAYLSAFLPQSGVYGLLVETANGLPGDFTLELNGRAAVQSDRLEFGVPVRVDIPQNATPQYFTFEADPYCPTTLTVYDISAGQPYTYPFILKVRDEQGIEVGMLRGGRIVENRLTVAPDGDPAPDSEVYEVEVFTADLQLEGSLQLIVTCADQAPACLFVPAAGDTPTPTPTPDGNGGSGMPTPPPPTVDPCVTPTIVLVFPTRDVSGSLPDDDTDDGPPSISVLPSDPIVSAAGDDTDDGPPSISLPQVDPVVSAATPTRDLTLGFGGDDSDGDGPPSLLIPERRGDDPTPDPCLPPPVTIVPRITTTPRGPDCSLFRLTSPTDGLPNGVVTVYWDPLPNATSYRVNVYGEGGSPLLNSAQTPAPNTSLNIDVSVGAIGPGFQFVLQVQALIDGQVVCSDSIRLFRESPGGDPGGRPRDDGDDDDGGGVPTLCPPILACPP